MNISSFISWCLRDPGAPWEQTYIDTVPMLGPGMDIQVSLLDQRTWRRGNGDRNNKASESLIVTEEERLGILRQFQYQGTSIPVTLGEGVELRGETQTEDTLLCSDATQSPREVEARGTEAPGTTSEARTGHRFWASSPAQPQPS